jgi:hypothetical protein
MIDVEGKWSKPSRHLTDPRDHATGMISAARSLRIVLFLLRFDKPDGVISFIHIIHTSTRMVPKAPPGGLLTPSQQRPSIERRAGHQPVALLSSAISTTSRFKRRRGGQCLRHRPPVYAVLRNAFQVGIEIR